MRGIDGSVRHQHTGRSLAATTSCPSTRSSTTATTTSPPSWRRPARGGIDVYFENVGRAIWQAVLPLLNKFARVRVSGLIAQYNGAGPGDGTDRLPATMREILSKSLTAHGFINNEFAAEHYPAFLREVGDGIADGRIRDREDIVAGLERAPETFIGLLEGRNVGKLIVRVAGSRLRHTFASHMLPVIGVRVAV